MPAIRSDIVRTWMKKADTDLRSAKKLASGKDPFLETALYHCQQSAEKSIKAYLISKDIEVVETHDLRFLVNKSVEIDAAFVYLHDLAEILNPYSVEYRYPDDIAEPDKAQFKEAYISAAEFMEFIQSKI